MFTKWIFNPNIQTRLNLYRFQPYFPECPFPWGKMFLSDKIQMSLQQTQMLTIRFKTLSAPLYTKMKTLFAKLFACFIFIINQFQMRHISHNCSHFFSYMAGCFKYCYFMFLVLPLLCGLPGHFDHWKTYHSDVETVTFNEEHLAQGSEPYDHKYHYSTIIFTIGKSPLQVQYYVLIEWEGGLNGKISGSQSGHTEL